MTAPLPQAAYKMCTLRLVIRSTPPDDAKALYGNLSTPENFPFSSVPPDTSPGGMCAHIERWGHDTASGKKAILMVTLRETGEVIGHGGFNCFETTEGQTFDVALQNAQDEKEEVEGSCIEERRAAPYLTDFGVLLNHHHWIEFAIEEIGCSIVRIETDLKNERWRALMTSIGLGRLEVEQPVTYGEHNIGWVYKIDRKTWSEAREGLKRGGEWFYEHGDSAVVRERQTT
ncbi:uncharacterized protein ColSpa_02144 [Colletotrichum spaethianum]|uniref:Acetyltransferase n=1 Tax=Colletotrichum spaethianum TaxID=700344 RepID=A0AA37NZB3_9PEZI|nr:uncharacterized protein ColSpa_02144 [Colletotrichum spaethianum]GKT41963.1 hypothetical protein ColSpa_02144 [Colletotrichum spaethianum]